MDCTNFNNFTPVNFNNNFNESDVQPEFNKQLLDFINPLKDNNEKTKPKFNNDAFFDNINDEELNENFKLLQHKAEEYEKDIPKLECYTLFKDLECNLKTAIPKFTSIVKGNIFNEYESQMHANTVTIGGFNTICSQAPYIIENTPCFWNAVWSENKVIVDLTKDNDYKRVHVIHETEKYYCPQTIIEEKKASNFTIKLQTQDRTLANCLKYTYSLSNTNEENEQDKIITRFHFNGWPDRGVITLQEMKNLITLFKEYSGNIIFHCLGGVGRTGTVVTCLALENISDQLTKNNYREIIDALILKGRQERGSGFVQTLQQYQLIINFAKNLITKSGASHTIAKVNSCFKIKEIEPYVFFPTLLREDVEARLKGKTTGYWIARYSPNSNNGKGGKVISLICNDKIYHISFNSYPSLYEVKLEKVKEFFNTKDFLSGLDLKQLV